MGVPVFREVLRCFGVPEFSTRQRNLSFNSKQNKKNQESTEKFCPSHLKQKKKLKNSVQNIHVKFVYLINKFMKIKI